MRGHAERNRQDAVLPAGFTPPREGATRLRVRYSECDPMNVAHHGAYPAWLELGRTELLRAGGVSYAQLEHAGVFLVVTRLEVRYRRPVLYDDVIEVRTRVKAAGRVKIDHEYEVVVVERGGSVREEVCAVASTTIACVDRDGRVRELPAWLAGVPASAT
ncbi:MAG: thioesterase [Phycisphaerae bacterium]|nr:MAG: thioesterase [Phycisphaerae bacterium]